MRRTPLSIQHGFTLLEITFSLILATSIVIGLLSVFQFNARLDQGRSVGTYMLQIDNAVIKYKADPTLRSKLLALPPECGQTTYAVGLSRNGTVLPGGASACQINVSKADNSIVSIPNGMQPSVANLQALGFMPSGFTDTLLLPTDPARRVAQANANGTPSNNSAGLDHYGIQILRTCQGTGSPCTQYALPSYVFNIQPYAVDANLFGSGPRLGAAVLAMGGRGYLAQLGGDGRLRYDGRNLDNPVLSSNAAGAAGAYGILASYDSDGTGGLVDDKYTYRDGTRPPTGNWDFNTKDLTNIGKLGVTKDASIGGQAQIQGGSKGGGVDLGSQSSLLHTQMRLTATYGAPCSTDQESFARNVASPDQLLFCNSGTWGGIQAAPPPPPPRVFSFYNRGQYGASLSQQLFYRIYFQIDYTDTKGANQTVKTGTVADNTMAQLSVPNDAKSIHVTGWYAPFAAYSYWTSWDLSDYPAATQNCYRERMRYDWISYQRGRGTPYGMDYSNMEWDRACSF